MDKVENTAIDYQDIYYYSAPKTAPKSLDEIDPEILRTYERRHSVARAAGAARHQKSANEAGEEGEQGEGGNGYGRVAVDAVFRFRFRRHLQGRAGQGRRAVHADLGNGTRVSSW